MKKNSPPANNEFATYLNACKASLRHVTFFSAISNLLMLAVPIYSLQVLNRVLSSGSMDTLAMLTLVVIGALVALTLLQGARARIMQQMGMWVESKLAPLVFTQSITSAASVRTVSGSQGLRDLGALRGFLGGPALAALLDAPWAIIFIGVLFAIHPVVGGMTVAGAAILVGLAMLDEQRSKPMMERASGQFLKSTAQLEMASRNAEAIEAMGMLPQIMNSWRNMHMQGLEFSLAGAQRASAISGASRFIRYVLQIAIIGVSAVLVLNNQMTAGAIIASSILVGRALAPFESIISSWAQLVSVREAYKRLSESLTKFAAREEEIGLPALKGAVHIENLTFVPPGAAKPVLRQVSLRVAAGETLGIIGPSGAGKSTLARMITGVWKPSAGIVRLDGAEACRWQRSELGKYVGYLPQDIELFAGTVKENIARMDASAPDAKVVEAAQRAGVHEMILALPKGYNTDIGVGGAMLSGGQRQRIALARALYGTPKLLVMDEPNSNLDGEGEAALMNAIRYIKSMEGTVIMIAHRPSMMMLADRLVLLKDGMVAAQGPRDEVFAQMNVGGKVTNIHEVRQKKTPVPV